MKWDCHGRGKTPGHEQEKAVVELTFLYGHIGNNFGWPLTQSETDLKKISDFAFFVDTTPQYVSRKKAKNDFSVEWAYKVGKKYNLLTEWIMTGEGPKKLGNKNNINCFYDLEKLGKEISKSDNLEWMTQQIDQAFPMFKEWRKRKEESKNNSPEIPASKIA